MTAKVGAPRPLPDRVFTIAKRFMDRYPNAQQIVTEFRDHAQENCAWLEGSIDAHTMTISCWYGDDFYKCTRGMMRLAAALKEWDRNQ